MLAFVKSLSLITSTLKNCGFTYISLGSLIHSYFPLKSLDYFLSEGTLHTCPFLLCIFFENHTDLGFRAQVLSVTYRLPCQPEVLLKQFSVKTVASLAPPPKKGAEEILSKNLYLSVLLRPWEHCV